MIQKDQTGKTVLSYEVHGVVRRIPIEKRGVSKRGNEWTLGGVLLEVSETEVDGSAQLYLTAWGDEKVEEINRIGVGKNVVAKFHIETREAFDRFSTDVILDEIQIEYSK